MGRLSAIASLCVALLAGPAWAFAVKSQQVTHRPRFLTSVPRRPIGGGLVGFEGSVRGAPAGSVVILEQLKARHRWSAITRAPVRGGHFFMQWSVPEVRSLTVRLTLRAGSRALVSTAPGTVYPRKVLVKGCSTPRPPANVPAGDGWVTGGVYTVGGPAPGLDVCRGALTLTVSNQSGVVVATSQVAEGASYTLVLPPGSYNLAAGSRLAAGLTISECQGTASVTAGQETRANTVCSIP